MGEVVSEANRRGFTMHPLRHLPRIKSGVADTSPMKGEDEEQRRCAVCSTRRTRAPAHGVKPQNPYTAGAGNPRVSTSNLGVAANPREKDRAPQDESSSRRASRSHAS